MKLPRDNEPITTQFRGVEIEPNVRRLRIQPEIIKKLGFIINCNGCRAIRDKEPISRNHNEECRKRYEKYLEDQGGEQAEKVAKTWHRISEHFERKDLKIKNELQG